MQIVRRSTRPLYAALAACMTFAGSAVSGAAGTVVSPNRVVSGRPGVPCRVDYAYKWLDGMRGDATGMQVVGCDIRVSFRGVELTRKAGPARDVVIRKSVFTLVRPTPVGKIPTGIQVKWAINTLIEDVVAQDFRSAPADGEYENGDGFASEFAVGLTYRRALARNNSNGGFYDKGRDVRYENTVSENNDFGYRMWWRNAGNFRGTTMTCRNNRSSCLQLNRGKKPGVGAAHVEIDHLVVENDRATPIARMAAGTTLIVHRCTIRQPGGQPFFSGMNGAGPKDVSLVLDASCRQ